MVELVLPKFLEWDHVPSHPPVSQPAMSHGRLACHVRRPQAAQRLFPKWHFGAPSGGDAERDEAVQVPHLCPISFNLAWTEAWVGVSHDQPKEWVLQSVHSISDAEDC